MNYRYMEHMVDLLRGYGVDTIYFQHIYFSDQESVARHEKVVKQLFGIDSTHWRGSVIDYAKKMDCDFLSKSITNLRNNGKVKVIFSPDLMGSELICYYHTPREFFRRFPRACKAPWIECTIQPNGDVELCPDIVVGNVKSDRLSKIWNGEKARRFRSFIAKHKRLPACKACCSIFKW